VGITATKLTYKFRCVLSDAGGNTVTTDAVKMVKPVPEPLVPLAITSQPVNYTGAIGDTATFTVAATGDGVTYQWQLSKNGGAAWSNISGATSASFSVGITATKLTYKFRCVLGDAGGNTLTTNAVKMVKA
jgi:hypothetical protein